MISGTILATWNLTFLRSFYLEAVFFWGGLPFISSALAAAAAALALRLALLPLLGRAEDFSVVGCEGASNISCFVTDRMMRVCCGGGTITKAWVVHEPSASTLTSKECASFMVSARDVCLF